MYGMEGGKETIDTCVLVEGGGGRNRYLDYHIIDSKDAQFSLEALRDTLVAMLVMERGRHLALAVARSALRTVVALVVLTAVVCVILAHLGGREAGVAENSLRKNLRHVVVLLLRARRVGT